MNNGIDSELGKSEIKMRRLEKVLLEASLSTSLNNCEYGSSCIKLTDISVPELYRRLSSDGTVEFKRPVSFFEDSKTDALCKLMSELGAPLGITAGDVGCEVDFDELWRILANMCRRERLALEDKGENVLCLFLGFVKDNCSSTFSPLVLLPVEIGKSTDGIPCVVSSRKDGEAVTNPVLVGRLIEDGIELPTFVQKECGIEEYFEIVRALFLKNGNTRQLVDGAALGVVSLKSSILYNDLRKHREEIKATRIFKAVSGELSSDNAVEEIKSAELDGISSKEPVCILGADAMQTRALLYADKGVSFVIDGAPGTGKSRTVANIIARAVSRGKRVLFLADAKESHRAIFDLLKLVGLDDIALPFYDGTSRIGEVIAGIKGDLQCENTGRSGGTVVDVERLDGIKKELGRYRSALHRKVFSVNRSLYDMIILFEENVEGAAVEYTPSVKVCDVTESDLSAQEAAVVKYAAAVSAVGGVPSNNPWRILDKNADRNGISEMKSDVTALYSVLSDCKVVLGQIYECPRLSESIGFGNLFELSEVLSRISELPSVTKEYLSAFDAKKLRGMLFEAENARAELEVLEQSANGVFVEDFGTTDEFNVVFSEHSRCTRDLLSLGMTVETIKSCLARYDEVIERLSGTEERSSAYRRTIENASFALGTILEVSSFDAKKAIFVIDSIGKSLYSDCLFDSSYLDAIRDKAYTARDIAARITEIKNTISITWRPEIIEVFERIDVDALRDSIEERASIWDGVKFDDESIALLLKYRSNGERFDIHNAFLLCDSIKEYKGLTSVYEPFSEEVGRAFGGRIEDTKYAWDSAISVIDRIFELKKLFGGFVPESVRRVILNGNAERFDDLRSELVEVVRALGEQDDLNVDFSFIKGDDAGPTVGKCRSTLERLYNALLDATPYLLRSDEPIDSIYDAVSALSSLSLGDTAQRVNNIEALISKVFKGIDGAFSDGSVDTRLLMHHIDVLETVLNMPLYPYVQELCCCDDSRKSELQGISRALSELCSRAFELKDGTTRLCDSLFDDSTLRKELCEGNIDGMMSALLPYAENLGGIESHFGRLSAILEAKSVGVGDFIEKAEEKGICENIPESFRKSFALAWINEALSHSGIREASIELYRENISDFSALQRASFEMNAEAVRQGIGVAEHDDDILDKLIKCIDGGITQGRLFELIPKWLLTQRPCIMTNSLAAVDMPHDDRYSFDLVVVDDASRITCAEVIGAISRGKQIIAVGDSGSDREMGGFSSEDSLFSELLYALPSLSLSVHYRSADESLIDFSNVTFYGGRLVSFPANTEHCDGRGVEYLYLPQGSLSCGVNIVEAEKCVELIFEHIKRNPDKTLGVITLEDAQREAIDDSVVQLSNERPELFGYLEACKAKGAPFFVKSLKELCGEVRDSIIISVCYAKNEVGGLGISFGDITESGGVGCFNSAITSAREGIRVVGSVRPVDFSLTADSPLGVRVLYEYIKYAWEGGRFDSGDLKAARLCVRDDFRDIVADFISENGYSVVKCVGRCADYRVDIAVESSRGSGVYVAAVECDGAYCNCAQTITDSFVTMSETLERLGWRRYRINPLLWYLNPECERRALLEFLRKSVFANKDAADIERDSDINSAVKDNERGLSQDNLAFFENTSEKDSGTNVVFGSEPSKLNAEKSHSPVVKSEGARSESDIIEDGFCNPYGFAVYRRRAVRALSEDAEAASEILEVVRLEEPIHKELLVERIAECLEVAGSTLDANTLVERLLTEKLSDTVSVDSDGFVRTCEHGSAVARACVSKDCVRAAEHISCEELSACIVGILEKCGCYDFDEIHTEISAVLGYPQGCEELFAPVKIAVYELVAEGVIVNDDGMLRLDDTFKKGLQ